MSPSTSPTPRPVWEPMPESRPGPALVTVMARLRATPQVFVSEGTDVVALVLDALDRVEDRVAATVLARFEGLEGLDRLGGVGGVDALGGLDGLDGLDVTRRLAATLTCWLVTAPEVVAALPAPRTPVVLDAVRAMVDLVAVLPLRRWLADDEDRREEVSRAFLRALLLRPADETHEIAEDRWISISSASRSEALRLAAQHQAWAEEVARKLAEEKAREAAAQYTHV